jgi:hypothetical protein
MKLPIGNQVSGTFSFLALYPFDTQVILRLPPRWLPKKAALETGRLERLRGLLNSAHIAVFPGAAQSNVPVLSFEIVQLERIFIDSPSAAWSTLRAGLPAHLFQKFLTNPELPEEVQFLGVKADLLLFEGGITILALESTYALAESMEWRGRFPQLLRRTAELTVRYKNEALTNYSKHLLSTFGARLRAAVAGAQGTGRGPISSSFQPFVSRIREVSVPELYPTIITRIFCKSTCQPGTLDLNACDLTEAMYLDASELTNALPSFEDDFIAVGYDSVWWLVADTQEERTDNFRDRVQLTFQYSLAISMLIYVLHTEIDQELSAVRTLRISRATPAESAVLVSKVRSLRGEVEDLLKELSLESFSTWVSDIFLFRTILQNWLVDASSSALRGKIDAVNVILGEIHQNHSELEQRELTRLGTIFAAASLSGLFVAAVTLFFTETHWEANRPWVALLFFLAKIAVVAYLVTLPWLLLWFIPKWDPRIRQAVSHMPNNQQ